MKSILRATLLRLCLVTVLPGLAQAGEAKEELKALIGRVQASIKAGQRTEATLKDELAAFDALLAAHRAEKTDDVAQILYMKATLFTQIIDDQEKGIALLKQLQADFPASPQAAAAPNLIAGIEAQRALAIGKSFPDFAEADLDGKPLSIAGYKGKVVLLDFWATWCGPCIAELPNVVAAYKKYHARGFDIIGISLDRADARQKLVDFTKKNEMPWAQYYDGKYWENKLSTRYGIRSIPATFLLDGDGRILAKDLRGAELDAAIEKALTAK